KLCSLAAEERPRAGIIQETNNISHPVRAIGIVHHGEDFHAGVFRIEKRHDAVIDWANGGSAYDIEELTRLVVDALQPPVGSNYVQPVGIEYVDLTRILAQRRKTGCVPR